MDIRQMHAQAPAFGSLLSQINFRQGLHLTKGWMRYGCSVTVGYMAALYLIRATVYTLDIR